jgi:MarR family transcriptional regulator, organic hydroperoxide resistance regulator
MHRTTARVKTLVRRDTERAALLAARTFVDAMRSRYRDLERQTGASIPMHRALACIAAVPGISASSLASALGMKSPAVSHVLKGLAERGWIERRRIPADQRSVQLHLSAAGRLTVEATAGRAVGTLQRAIGNLSDIEVAALSVGLTALLRTLPPPPRTAVAPQKRAR